MKGLSRSETCFDDVSSSHSEDFNRAHGKETLCKSQADDSSEDLSDSPYISSSFSAGQKDKDVTEKSKKSVFLKPWAGLLKKWRKADTESHSSYIVGIKILPNGTQCSPPVTPLPDRKHWDSPQDDDLKPNLASDSTGCMYDTLVESELTSIHPAEYYAEKLEVYKLKYSYLKSWPGLLRLLAGLELLFGGMVFACVCAYIQRDSEWSNLYRPLGDMQGYRYNGPMTPFVLVVVGLAWMLTMILLVLGLTMYYRTILLDSRWWPLTEAIMNLVIFLLYMSAGIVYVNDLNRGGLCFMTIGVNPILSNLCRVQGGQMAGTAFIFINMLMYLISFLVCLRMWRHEAARREREAVTSRTNNQGNRQLQHQSLEFTSNMGSSSRSKKISFKDEMNQSFLKESKLPDALERTQAREILTGAIPIGHIPKPKVIADYIIKYPEIHSVEDREKYKAVFNDQYQEYKELHREITVTLMKFQELDNTMSQLLKNPSNTAERKRIKSLLKTYEEKKNDPYFLEKKERCEYLKAKLSHIKMRIRNFDQNFSSKDRN
ncbi:putative occludin/ELL domain-containing protein 1 [Triplophysa rosa]|nr:putative occludin/ELL domain-containing protein 1 [Triplophysa rosa]